MKELNERLNVILSKQERSNKTKIEGSGNENEGFDKWESKKVRKKENFQSDKNGTRKRI